MFEDLLHIESDQNGNPCFVGWLVGWFLKIYKGHLMSYQLTGHLSLSLPQFISWLVFSFWISIIDVTLKAASGSLLADWEGDGHICFSFCILVPPISKRFLWWLALLYFFLNYEQLYLLLALIISCVFNPLILRPPWIQIIMKSCWNKLEVSKCWL